MAETSTLPIYKSSYEFVLLIMRLIKNLPKDYKFSLGQKIKDESFDMVLLLYKANSSKDKQPFLDLLLDKIKVINLSLRLCKDLRIISVKQFSSAVILTDSISKQASGWRKWSAGTE